MEEHYNIGRQSYTIQHY